MHPSPPAKDLEIEQVDEEDDDEVLGAEEPAAEEPAITNGGAEVATASKSTLADAEEVSIRNYVGSEPAAHGCWHKVCSIVSSTTHQLVNLRREVFGLKEQLTQAETANQKLLNQLEKAKRIGRDLLAL
jgi:hypothetical protein